MKELKYLKNNSVLLDIFLVKILKKMIIVGFDFIIL